MIKDGIKERIAQRLVKIKSGKAKNYFLTNISYPQTEKEKDKYFVLNHLEQLEKILPEIKQLIRNIRPHFENIWDQNNIVASYLLLGKTYKNLEGVIREANNGNVSAFVELCRSGQEAIELTILFSDKNGDQFLNKWLSGEIVGNAKSREVMDKAINELNKLHSNKITPFKEIKFDIYSIYSQYTHSGYVSLLDMIDVFHEDFDFEEIAGFHYTRLYLPQIDSLVANVLLGLKNIFLITSDSENLNKTEELIKLFPNQFATDQEIDSIENDYKTNTK